MFKIFYNNLDAFSGIAPTPFVERTINSVYGAKKNQEVESFSLNGVIIGPHCQDGDEFPFFFDKANQLIDRFSQSFKEFSIVDEFDSGVSTVFSTPHAIVRNVNFPESNFAGILPFTVNIDTFTNDQWLGYGIQSPSQEIKFKDNGDGSVTIEKSVSAVGFQTDKHALDNAVEFVQGYTGWNDFLKPAFINSTNSDGAILMSFDEEIDRLAGSYGVRETWLYDVNGNVSANSFYKIQKSIESGVEGVSINLEGSFEGRHLADWTDLRNDFNLVDFYGVAESFYLENGYTGELAVLPFSKSISENSSSKKINFSFEYRDNVTEDPYLIDQFNASWQREDGKNCINVQLEINSADPCLSERWSKVKTYYENFDIYNYIVSKWNSYRFYFIEGGGEEDKSYWVTNGNKWSTFGNYWVTTFGKLSGSIQSKKVSFNEQKGTISISASLCEKRISVPEEFVDLTYSVQISPSMPTFVPFQGVNDGGNFTIQKLGGLKRKKVLIQGEGVIKSCNTKEEAELSLRDYINNLKNLYISSLDCFLSLNSVRFSSKDANKMFFSFEWNEDGEAIFDDNILNSSI